MKKLFFISCISFFGFTLSAQSALYTSLKQMISLQHPEIILENKLIAYNVWSVDDQESREANKNFEKAYSVYGHALLKGGSKGIVAVSLNKEDLSGAAVIAYTNDGITKLIPFKVSDLKGLDAKNYNSVFDQEGKLVYSNLAPGEIFESIHHLITR